MHELTPMPWLRRTAARLVATTAILAACSVEPPPTDQPATEVRPADVPLTAREGPPPVAADTARAISFTCDDVFQFTLLPRDGSGTLFLPDTTLVLERTTAATGHRYTRAGVELWFDDATATLDLPSAARSGCARRDGADPWTAARLRGARFRAIGQEPGWFVEIHDDSIHFTGDYGERTFSLPTDAFHRTDSGFHWTAAGDAHSLDITATRTPCQDAMSGEASPYTVVAVADTTRLRGCGRRLD